MLSSAYAFKNLSGIRTANSHVSVRNGSDAKKTYEAIAKAVRNDPFQDDVRRAMDRVRGIQKGFERMAQLSKRVRDKVQVSRGDAVRMNKEYQHLRERISLLISDKLYDQPLQLSSNNAYAQGERPVAENLRFRLNQLFDGIWQGDYSQSQETVFNVLRSVRASYFNRYDGNPLEDLVLQFEGPQKLFSRNLIAEHTALDFPNDLDQIKLDPDHDEPEEAWLQSAAKAIGERIIENPGRALATQIEGIEKSGQVLLSLTQIETSGRQGEKSTQDFGNWGNAHFA